MILRMLKSKIHNARVTDADVAYEGSITIDEDLMEAADLREFEEVHVWDVTNGARLITYVIKGARGSGDVAMNGAAAHLMNVDDRLIIGCFASYREEELSQQVARKVFVDERNAIVRTELHPYVPSEDARPSGRGRNEGDASE